jgi:hypothetical protein
VKHRLFLGAVVAVVYLVGAAITAHLTPFGAPPVLDGLTAPPPYRWVKPPADLAATNQKPFGGTFSLKFTRGRSEAGAFTTRDSQLSMVLDPGALPREGTPTGARISITPMAPSSLTEPSGYTIDGNVYRVEIKETPAGTAVNRFANPQRVILVYPADKSFLKPQHLLAISSDGKSWTRLKTQDSTIQQQSSALIGSPGFLAVVTPIKSKSSTKATAVYVAVAFAILVVVGVVAWQLYRRSQRSRPRGR